MSMCFCGSDHAGSQTDMGECNDEPNLFVSPLSPTEYPVEVLIDGKTSNHNVSLILDALDAWNDRIGEEILYATVTNDLAGMHGMCNYTTVTTDKILEYPQIGLTTYGPCAADHVDIETMDLVAGRPEAYIFTDWYVTYIATHELGHVLGLDHELDITSIMYPSIVNGGHSISRRSACLVKLAVLTSRIKKPNAPTWTQ